MAKSFTRVANYRDANSTKRPLMQNQNEARKASVFGELNLVILRLPNKQENKAYFHSLRYSSISPLKYIEVYEGPETTNAHSLTFQTSNALMDLGASPMR